MGLCKPLLGGGSILLAACLLLPAGCGKKDDKKAGATTTVATTTGATTTGATTTGEGTHAKKGDDHILLAPSAGAHDYHVRLKIDTKGKTAHATIYDKENEEKKPIDAETLTLSVKGDKTQVELKCQRAEGDPKDKCSHYTATHDRFAAPIAPESIVIRAFIAKKQYVFELDKD